MGRIKGTLSLGLWALVALGGRHAACQDAKAPAGEQAVRKLALLYVAPIGTEAAVPLDKAAELLADDVFAVWSDGRTVKGKEALLTRSRQAIREVRDAFETFAVTYNIRSVRVFKETALVVGDVALRGRLKEGKAPWSRAVWMSLLFRRTPQGWRLILEHSTRAAAPPPQGDNRGEL